MMNMLGRALHNFNKLADCLMQGLFPLQPPHRGCHLPTPTQESKESSMFSWQERASDRHGKAAPAVDMWRILCFPGHGLGVAAPHGGVAEACHALVLHFDLGKQFSLQDRA